jgi:hypothetical protein
MGIEPVHRAPSGSKRPNLHCGPRSGCDGGCAPVLTAWRQIIPSWFWWSARRRGSRRGDAAGGWIEARPSGAEGRRKLIERSALGGCLDLDHHLPKHQPRTSSSNAHGMITVNAHTKTRTAAKLCPVADLNMSRRIAIKWRASWNRKGIRGRTEPIATGRAAARSGHACRIGVATMGLASPLRLGWCRPKNDARERSNGNDSQNCPNQD